ncbi:MULTISPECIES: trypsin-like serine peptidase [Streptomyces]|nr:MULTISPECIES: trypsin-like peptidase domain-containing protein [Streptomyces]MYV95239.1 trypsin-like serine protease [Streptomyces sp. SID1034]
MAAAIAADTSTTSAPAGAAPARDNARAAVAPSARTLAGHDARSVGRLFIHKPHQDFSCTAVTVEGGRNKNLAATAAHCLSDSNGAVVSALYVPAYVDGNRPFDSFPLRSWVAALGYDPQNPSNHDAAFMTLGPNCCGQNAGDVSIMNLVDFNDGPYQRVTVVGYGNSQGDMSKQYACSDAGGYPDPDNSTRIAVNCRLGGGASGGPFFVQSQPGHWDKVIGVIRGHTGTASREVGPLYGSHEEAAWHQAISDS